MRQLQFLVELFVDCVITLVTYEIPRADMSIPIYSNISQLPFVAHVLMTLFYNKKFWAPMFIHILNNKLSSKSFNLKSVIASILILHLYAGNDKKMNEAEMKKAVNSALNILNKEKRSIEKDKENERMFVDGPTDTDTDKVWLNVPSLTTHTNTNTNTDCATWGSKDGVERRTGSGVKDDRTSNVANDGDATSERRLTVASNNSTKTDLNEYVSCILKINIFLV